MPFLSQSVRSLHPLPLHSVCSAYGTIIQPFFCSFVSFHRQQRERGRIEGLHCKCLFYPDWPTQRCFPAAKTVMVRYYASCLVNCGTNREQENASRARLCESLALDARNALNLSVTFLLIHANPLQIGLSIACRAMPSARPPPTRRASLSRIFM